MRCIFAGCTGNMTLEDLHVLERQLEMWIYNVRATKMQHMIQEIQLLRNKKKTPAYFIASSQVAAISKIQYFHSSHRRHAENETWMHFVQNNGKTSFRFRIRILVGGRR